MLIDYVVLVGTYHFPMLFPCNIESLFPSFPAITMGTALEERQPNVHGAVLCSLPTQTLVGTYHHLLVTIPLC